MGQNAGLNTTGTVVANAEVRKFGMRDKNAKGSFYGITMTHKKEYFIRTVLEGTAKDFC